MMQPDRTAAQSAATADMIGRTEWPGARAPADAAALKQQITLMQMPQLAEAKGGDDDWTGTTDARARRKRQTRLNTRAYRKRRKALQAVWSADSPVNTPETALNSTRQNLAVPFWDDGRQSITILPASAAGAWPSRAPLLPCQSWPPPNPDPSHKVLFPLTSDHLIVLLQFNVLRACLTNRDLLIAAGVFSASYSRECTATTVTHTLALPARPGLLPPALYPTRLQQTVPHDDWIDILPHPAGRDNLIRAAGAYDEDALWADTIGGLFDGFPGDEVERRGVVVWAPPWDPAGWDLSPGFVRRWGWHFRGCEDVALQATNRWRRLRGEEPLVWEVE